MEHPTRHQTLSGLRISMASIYTPLIFIGVFAGFQGGRYYLANRLQEVGIAAALALFAFGMWRAAYRLPYSEWRRWVLSPILLIGGIMGISSVVFVLNYSGNVLYSFFSAREFMLGFIGPGLYLLYRSGLRVELVKGAVWTALAALLVNYLYFYNTLDLREAFFSSDHTISNLVTYDEWRGFRLKPPLFALMVAVLGSVILVTKGPSVSHRLLGILILALGGYIWSIVMFRATLATMLLSIALYPLLMHRASQAKLLLVAMPLVLIAAPTVATFTVDHFLNADGGEIRAKAFMKALAHIGHHPVLGAGEDSAYGDSYQDIVAPYFYPSDLGLIGTTYKYGLVGVTLYVFMHFKIWAQLWRANLLARATSGKIEPLLWGLLVFMSAQTFNLALNPGLTYAQGITLGSLALALAGIQRNQTKKVCSN